MVDPPRPGQIADQHFTGIRILFATMFGELFSPSASVAHIFRTSSQPSYDAQGTTSHSVAACVAVSCSPLPDRVAINANIADSPVSLRRYAYGPHCSRSKLPLLEGLRLRPSTQICVSHQIMEFAGCSNDGAMEPAVVGCRGDFDFTIKFEKMFFSLIPSTSVQSALSL